MKSRMIFRNPIPIILRTILIIPSRLKSFQNLLKFDGSVIAERTKGEVSSRCDTEAANISALNLLNDIVIGKLNAEEARDKYCNYFSAFMMNRPAPYVKELQFDAAAKPTYDTNRMMIAVEMAEQAGEKVKDIFNDKFGSDRLH